VLLSYCVVNTNGREPLLACLDAIERDRPAGIESEVLVLDNASEDDSAAAVRARDGETRLIALDRRAGKAANDSRLLAEAGGEYGWVQSSAMLVRREAAERVGWLDPAFFVYSDETDFCKRLRDAGFEILFVPAAPCSHSPTCSERSAP
jgi:GT2 family glycosyltransferase